MNTVTLLHFLSAILTVLLASTFVLISTTGVTPAPSSPVAGGCANSVISFSPCLPYISAPPNNLSVEPSSQCCDIFNGAFDSGEAECLCYLVRQSTLLGFPLNATKLLSLSDLCSVNNSSKANNTINTSLESVCLGSPTLPPLVSTTDKPRPGSNAHPTPRRSPRRFPSPRPPTISMPGSANSESGQSTGKPDTSKQSSKGNHLAPVNAITWCVRFIFL